jgi:hypothetical protein
MRRLSNGAKYPRRGRKERNDETCDVVSAFQEKRIVLWGCGGLGSWIGEFLVRAGVGQIVLSDPADAIGGLLVRQNYEELDVGDGKAPSLNEAGKMVKQDADLEPFRVFWEEPSPADEVIPAPGCSVPTFHGSAADLAAISGVLISFLGQHLSIDTPGTHLVSLPHGPGASIPHCFVESE